MEKINMSEIPIGKIIEQEVRSREISISEFARLINTDRRNVYNIFQRENIDIVLLLKISKALGKDFFAVYSEYLKKIL